MMIRKNKNKHGIISYTLTPECKEEVDMLEGIKQWIECVAKRRHSVTDSPSSNAKGLCSGTLSLKDLVSPFSQEKQADKSDPQSQHPQH